MRRTALPAFDGHGLLPRGVHACGWHQLRTRFAFTPRRRELTRLLCRFARQELRPLQLPGPLFIDGSYVRNKPVPADVDVVLDLSAHPWDSMLPAVSLFLDRKRLKTEYAVDFWLRHPMMPNDLCAFFEYVGDKAAADLGLAAQWPKGILRIGP